MSTPSATLDSDYLEPIHASLQAALSGGGFLILDLRRHFLEPGQDPEAACEWARLLNEVPLPSPVFRSSGRQIWEVVESVLTHGELDLEARTQENVAWWKGMLAKLARNWRQLPSGKGWVETRTSPSYTGFFSAAGWTDYEFTAELIPAPGGGTAVVHVRARLLRVSIVRPWLDGFLFRARWHWKPGAPDEGTLISDGVSFPDGTLPSGTMPLLPMAAILAKDVEITVQVGEKAHPAGLAGPFTLSSGEGIQVVGWLCTVLPRCPDLRGGSADPPLR